MPKPPTTTRPRQLSPHMTSQPDNPPYDMPTSLWPLSYMATPPNAPQSQSQSLIFNPQIYHTPPPQPTIPHFTAYQAYSQPYTNPPYQTTTPLTTYSPFSQPLPPYTQPQIHILINSNSHQYTIGQDRANHGLSKHPTPTQPYPTSLTTTKVRRTSLLSRSVEV
jgi:hypothetical protein